jgi:hypothetical protein
LRHHDSDRIALDLGQIVVIFRTNTTEFELFNPNNDDIRGNLEAQGYDIIEFSNKLLDALEI